MNRILSATLLLFILLWMGGCATLQVNNDYDPDYDFSHLESFAIVQSDPGGVVTLTQERLMRAITETLEAKGYTPTSRERADFHILFHTDVKEFKEVVTDYDAIGFYPYDYGWWGPPYPTRREYTYEEAQIVIDAIDPEAKKVFWRGTAVDLLKSFKTPREREAYINEVVRKILAPFPSRPQPPKSRS
ncbi:DUF4136 domain-containing protein [Hydrogenimonas sp.]